MLKASILSQDGCSPIVFPQGALYTFGDTFLGRIGTGKSVFFEGGVSNSLLCFSGGGQGSGWSYLTDEKGKGREFIEFLPRENWQENRLWPGAGVYANGRFYVYYEVAKSKGNGLGFDKARRWGLMRSGSSWRSWERTQPRGAFPFLGLPKAVVRDGKGTLFVYFLQKVGSGSMVRVAQVPESDVESPSAYRLLDAAAARDAPDSVSVAWNDFLGCYVMCHAGARNSREIVIRRSASPAGPFSAPERVYGFSPQTPGEGSEGMIYSTFLQPAMFRESGRIMAMTFCVVEKNALPHLVEFQVKKKV